MVLSLHVRPQDDRLVFVQNAASEDKSDSIEIVLDWPELLNQ